MLKTKLKISRVVGIFTTVVAIHCGLGTFGTIVQAQESSQNNEGLPAHRRDGGTRGGCVADGNNFVALVPDNSINITAMVSPKLFFYVPQTSESKTIEFIVRDEQDKLVHEAFLQTTGEQGIMSVQVPENVRNVLAESTSDYHWYLSMICDPEQRSRDLVIEGWIEYVELDESVKEKIANSSAIEQADLYQEEGIWYDALSVVAEEASTVSDGQSSSFRDRESTAKWSELLESIGLSELSAQPFIKH